jgi:Domain of unknown function (DUF4145)
MTTMRELRLDQRVSFCPHCGNTSLQGLLYAHNTSPKCYEMGELIELGEYHQFFLATCETCDTVLLYYLHSLNMLETPSPFQQAALEWPTSVELPDSVPDNIRLHYAEAGRTKLIAPNAYAVLIRKSLEALCDDRATAKGPLATRLRELAFRDEIPPLLAEMGDILRQLGNVGAHNDSSQVSVGDADAMDQFFRAIVEYVYVGPDRLRHFRAAQQISSKRSEDAGSETKPVDTGQKPSIH